MPTGEFTDSVRHLPDQLRDIAVAAADLDGLPPVDGVTSVVILGTGGARVGGDALEAICELTAQVPIVATAFFPATNSSVVLNTFIALLFLLIRAALFLIFFWFR